MHHRYSFAAMLSILVSASLSFTVLPSSPTLSTLPPPVQLISYQSPGRTPPTGKWSFRPAISADGRFIAFSSEASDLVDGDTNGMWDVFIRDRLNGNIERVSVGSNGEQGDGQSGSWSSPSLSADGRFVAFASLADNLSPRDQNLSADVFVRDRLTGRTELISHTPGGNSASGWSDWPVISGDGRYVSFSSTAPDLVPGDANGMRDIFRFDRQTNQAALVSVASDGFQPKVDSGWASALSQDGQIVAFASPSKDLIPKDRNGSWDVFVHDFSGGQTQRVSVSTYNGEGNGNSGNASSLGISADGSRVVFQSAASTLSRNDQNYAVDIFVRDWREGWTVRVSLNSDGNEASGDCVWPAISPDGRYVSFTCQAPNLVEEDTNSAWDVFVRDLQNHHTSRVSTAPNGDQSLQPSGFLNSAPLSMGGEWIAYPSRGSKAGSGWNVYLAYFPLQRGMEIVREARNDLDMPYCQEPAPTFRGCPDGKDCGGPYHGYHCGVCTDLVLDSYLAGSGFDLQTVLWKDRQAHPERSYTWSDMRSAQDMRLFFDYTNAMLSWNDPFLPGDIVFFDWEGDGSADHVAVVSLVNSNGRPVRLISAQGPLATNPDGLTHDIPWKAYHTRALIGHARP